MRKILFATALFLAGFAATAQKKSVSIAFYNIENLFDTINNPATKDEEFLPEGSLHWNTERLDKKITNLASVIKVLADKKAPDIIGFCEVENGAVLGQLLQAKVLKNAYSYVHFDSPDERGIDVALAYQTKKFTVLSSRSVNVVLNSTPGDRTRDILYVTLQDKKNKEILHLFVNHFPSRSGGQEESAPRRADAAHTLRRLTDSLLQNNASANIIAMGDFNDEPADFSIRIALGAQPSAQLLPANGLVALMSPLKDAGQGSYYYKKSYEMIDQFIVSKAMVTGTSHTTVTTPVIYNQAWVMEQQGDYKGAPLRTFAGKKYLGGYSDHFPVYMWLQYKK